MIVDELTSFKSELRQLSICITRKNLFILIVERNTSTVFYAQPVLSLKRLILHNLMFNNFTKLTKLPNLTKLT